MNFESICVLVDLERPSSAVLRSAAQIAAAGVLCVDLVVVLPHGEGDPAAVAEVEDGMRSAAQARLQEVERDLLAHCETETVVVRTVLFGDAEGEVAAHSASVGHDLLIVDEHQALLAGRLTLSVLVVR